MRIEPEITGVSLVLLGDFNPPIFTPSWFGWQGLLSENMVDDAELEIDAVDFITSSHMAVVQLQVIVPKLVG